MSKCRHAWQRRHLAWVARQPDRLADGLVSVIASAAEPWSSPCAPPTPPSTAAATTARDAILLAFGTHRSRLRPLPADGLQSRRTSAGRCCRPRPTSHGQLPHHRIAGRHPGPGPCCPSGLPINGYRVCFASREPPSWRVFAGLLPTWRFRHVQGREWACRHVDRSFQAPTASR